jgi:hypothetical protein
MKAEDIGLIIRPRPCTRFGKAAALLALLAACSGPSDITLQTDQVGQSSSPLAASAFVFPSRWSADFGLKANWTDNNSFPRMMADVNGDGRRDIVGFGHLGAYVAFANAEGTSFFPAGDPKLAEFGYDTVGGGWNDNNIYPRMMADVNGDGKQDIVGFAKAGVYVAFAKADGTGFSSAGGPKLTEFGTFANWTNNTSFPRTMADVNGDGKQDIVGFGHLGVYVAFAKTDGTGFLSAGNPKLAEFGYDTVGGGWNDDNIYPRMMADVNGDGKQDIVGFAKAGVYVAFAKADGTGFLPAGGPKLTEFGTFANWTANNIYPRMMADVNGDGKQDIVGFGPLGVYVAFAKADGTGFLSAGNPKLNEFGHDASSGGWTDNNIYPRMMADINGDGKQDIAGFGKAGVTVALAKEDGTGFYPGTLWVADYGTQTRNYWECWEPGYLGQPTGCGNREVAAWTTNNAYPRMVMDVTGDRRAEIVGFGDDGVIVTQQRNIQTICDRAAGVDLGQLTDTATTLVNIGPRNSYVQITCAENTCAGQNSDNLTIAATALRQLYNASGYVVTLEPVRLCDTWDGSNVIVTKTGSLYPNSFIEIGAHYDSHYHSPGAGDNAVGAAAVVELARLLKSWPARHSIRFINYVGHEHRKWVGNTCENGCGNQGSVSHLQLALGRGETIMAGVNLDGIGWSELDPTNSGNDSAHMNVVAFAARPDYRQANSERVANLFNAVLPACGIGLNWRKATWPSGDNLSYWGRTDLLQGVEPMLSAEIPAVLGIGGLPYDPNHYTDYHNCGDTMNKVNMVNVQRTTQQTLAAVLALDLLDSSP